ACLGLAKYVPTKPHTATATATGAYVTSLIEALICYMITHASPPPLPPQFFAQTPSAKH
ncbi:hypothetical protein COCMIDRAFT_87791, partial [Bipolaris oryzae ATCC 44560]